MSIQSAGDSAQHAASGQYMSIMVLQGKEGEGDTGEKEKEGEGKEERVVRERKGERGEMEEERERPQPGRLERVGPPFSRPPRFPV